MSSTAQLDDRDSTKRFSSRVSNYVRYRPGYPAEIIELLKTECGLTRASVVADVGSGTGKLTELFLTNGNLVFGIEPNQEMREAGERLLATSANFTSIAATAEETTLSGASVDLIVAGQAFHWFDRKRCRAEFARILKPGGSVVLIWNDRQTTTTSFLAEYEQLLKNCATDYSKVDHKQIDDEVVGEFFGYVPQKRVFPSLQEFDYDGLKGRLLSSSYAPEEGQPKYEKMISDLEKLFAKREQGGRVQFVYDTVLYYGRLN